MWYGWRDKNHAVIIGGSRSWGELHASYQRILGIIIPSHLADGWLSKMDKIVKENFN